ncbi:MAG: VWA domain-containing protein [Flavobacteriales bacterium]|nr:VWA domain-containing protein [Flavobacteriales bacterium]
MHRAPDRWVLLGWTLAALVGAACVTYLLVQRYELANPNVLWFLLLLVPVVVLRYWREGRQATQVRMSAMKSQLQRPFDLVAFLRPMSFSAAIAGTALLLLAMARPQSHDSKEDVKREGIDIVIAFDISASMLAKDLKPNRLEASKRVGMDFIDGRPNDRIGLVVYEGEAYTQCPLTTDHRVLKELFDGSRSGLIQGGTAVGMGLATALNRLRESTAKSKVVILLTDGVNNTGTVQPVDAAMIAEELGIRVYTIGVGTRGKALTPVTQYSDGQYRYEYVDVDLDEATLEQIASMTGGKYFRATDERKLKEIYAEIDRLEKTRIEVEQFTFRIEEYHELALFGCLLLLTGGVLDRTLFRGMA